MKPPPSPRASCRWRRWCATRVLLLAGLVGVDGLCYGSQQGVQQGARLLPPKVVLPRRRLFQFDKALQQAQLRKLAGQSTQASSQHTHRPTGHMRFRHLGLPSMVEHQRRIEGAESRPSGPCASHEPSAATKSLLAETDDKVRSAAAHNDNTVILAMGTGGYNLLAHNLALSLQQASPALAASFCFVALDDLAREANIAPCVLDGLLIMRHATEGMSRKVGGGPGAACQENLTRFDTEVASVDGRSQVFNLDDKQWQPLMLVRWRLAYYAVQLGLSVTVLDLDLAVLRDFTQVLHSHLADDPDIDVVRYCCGNVGMLHFAERSHQRILPFIENFIVNLTRGGGWEQRMFQLNGIPANGLKVLDTDELKPGDGCHLWPAHIRELPHGSGNWTVGAAGASRWWATAEAKPYLVHADCVTGLYLKSWMLRSVLAWWAEPERYEQTTEKYLVLENANLLDWGEVPPPNDFEAGELARAIGLAIALNRTLVLPFSRCRTRDPGNHFHLKDFPVAEWASSSGLPLQAPEADPLIALSRFCFPYEPTGSSPMITTNVADTWGFSKDKTDKTKKRETRGEQPQQITRNLHIVSTNVVQMVEPTFVFNPRVPRERLAHPPFLLGMQDGAMQAVQAGADLHAYHQRVVSESLESIGDLTPRHAMLCGERVREWIEKNDLENQPLLQLASAHQFRGFVRGSQEDERYKHALQILHAEMFYSPCDEGVP